MPHERSGKRRGTAIWALYIGLDEHGVYMKMDTEQAENSWYLDDADTDYPDPYYDSLQALAPIMRRNETQDAQLTLTFEVEGKHPLPNPREPLHYELEEYCLFDIGVDPRSYDVPVRSDGSIPDDLLEDEEIPIPREIAEIIADEFAEEIYDIVKDTHLHYEDILKVAATVTEDLI